ncbi:MAG TPA: hypothetical protein VH592_17515 [Gemmataceae bacterium]|jgi:hypothetical protein
MRRLLGFLMLAFLAAACSPSANESNAADGDKDKGKGVVVDLDGLKSTAPGDWKEEAPSNRMRFMQFRLPKKGDEKHDAELIIFRNISGTAKENVKRWKDQFTAPEGKTIDDVAKVEEMKVSGAELTYLDVSGTYTFKTRPFDPGDKGEKRPNYRMLAVQFDAPKNVYHIKLTGPAKTVETYKKGFDEWVKNFK